MNCQSIKNKKPELFSIIDSSKPDIIFGSESWLTPNIANSEIFPENYDAFRKDRNDGHGGVFLAHKKEFVCSATPELQSNCESVWCKLEIVGCKTLYLCSFYRPPDVTDPTYLDQFNTSLHRIMSYKNANILIGGDFNCGDVDWDNMHVPPGVPKVNTQRQLVDIVQEHSLSQVINIPTRQDKTLDILLTNNPAPVTRVRGMPPIGKSDHDIVFTEYDIKAKRVRQTPRKILLYRRADMDGLRNHIRTFSANFLSFAASKTVNEMWCDFRDELAIAIDKFIPSKMTKPKYSCPWIDTSIKRLIHKREKLYHKVRNSTSPELKTKYKEFRAHVQKSIRDAYWRYISGIFTEQTDDNDTDHTRTTNKKFWSFIKSQKNDSSNIASLRDNGILKSDTKTKANILNSQFKSVFTSEPDGALPNKGPSPFPSMEDIFVDTNGIEKLLGKLNPHKASGPDNISARVLNECRKEISPILACIFNKSIQDGTVPDDWCLANVAPIFKKGEKYDPANYRPVSLTCICCKSLEHIMVSNIMKHLASNNILVDSQHGFRSRRSCESQLVQFVHDLSSNLDRAHNKGHRQTDIIIMDFAKAFDKVPHRRLLHKLKHYGIRGLANNWICSFLTGRTQKVVLDGVASEPADVISGVPQGSVLGPVLFLLYINDLPDNINSSVRLFADDCVLYRNIHTDSDCQALQDDIDKLAKWEETWLMKFNASKCHTLRVTNHQPHTRLILNYKLHDQVLESVSSAKYLGLTFADSLSWSSHIHNVTSKANRTLGFLRRNLAFAPRSTRDVAYKTLVRPQLEFASCIWNPYTETDISKVEKIQRTAARWCCRRWRNRSHVGEMLEDLSWPTLAQRRDNSSLVFFYKIHNGLVEIDKSQYLQHIPNPRSTRSSSNHPYQYSIPLAYSDTFKFSFFPRTVPPWNCLPIGAVSSETVLGFKSQI
ncbi:MAG: reverse transcriptase family protein [Sedimenticola sp.]